MRLAVLMIIVTASCGGGGRKPAAKPDPDQVEGDLLRPDPRYDEPNMRASQVVSTPPPEGPSHPAPRGTDEPPEYAATSGDPSFGSGPLPAATEQPAAKGCNAEPFTTEGNDKLAAGMPAQALAAFERSIVCVHDPKIEALAVVAACKAKLYSRARAHLVRVAAESRDPLIQLCRPPHP
jgi:hypothetical protein